MLRLAFGRRRTPRLAPCAALFVAAWLTLHAENWTTTNGKVYRNVTVLSHTNVSVTILHADGGATINLLLLPPEIQQRFGIDRAAALAAKQQDDAEAAREAAAIQAQKDKAAADEKARLDAIAANQAFHEKDRANDKKQLDASSQKAAADYAAQPKTVVTGRVLFLTSDKQEIDYGGIHVRLFSYEQARAALDMLSDRAGDQQKKLETEIDLEKQNYQRDAAMPLPKAGPAHDAAAKIAKDALGLYLGSWHVYYSYASQDYFANGLTGAVADVVTDPAGNFTMPIPATGSWVLVALGRQAPGPDKDGHLWIAKVDPAAVEKKEVVLDNSNLTGDASLMCVMSDADIDNLIQSKMDEVTSK